MLMEGVMVGEACGVQKDQKQGLVLQLLRPAQARQQAAGRTGLAQEWMLDDHTHTR